MSVAKKRKTEAKEEIKAKPDQFPALESPQFQPVPATTISLIRSSPLAGKRGEFLPLDVPKKPVKALPSAFDTIVPELKFSGTVLAEALEQNKAELNECAKIFGDNAKIKEGKEQKLTEKDHSLILKTQKKILAHTLVEGYEQMDTGYSWYRENTLLKADLYEPGSIFTSSGGNCLADILLETHDNERLNIERDALTEVCIQAYLITNGRVLKRTDADFSKPEFLFAFFASDFPQSGFVRRGTDLPDMTKLKTEPLGSILEDLLLKKFGDEEGFKASLESNITALWRKDYNKALRSQRYLQLPTDGFLPALGTDYDQVQTKEVKFRSAGGSKVSSTTYSIPFSATNSKNRNHLAFFGFPLLCVSANATPYRPAVPPPSYVSISKWTHLCAATRGFTTSNEKRSKISRRAEKTDEIKLEEMEDDEDEEREQHFEDWDYAVTSPVAKQPYSFAKSSTSFHFVQFKQPNTDSLGDHPMHLTRLSNTSVYAWAELIGKPNCPPDFRRNPLQAWAEKVDEKKFNFLTGPLTKSLYLAGGTKFFIAVDTPCDLPANVRAFFEFCCDQLEKHKEENLSAIEILGLPSKAFLAPGRGSIVLDMDHCFKYFIYYLQCTGIFRTQKHALHAAYELCLMDSENIVRSDKNLILILRMLQVGERLFYSMMMREERVKNPECAFLSSPELAKTQRQLLLLQEMAPPNVLYKHKAGAVDWQQKTKQCSLSPLNGLMHKIRTLAHDFVHGDPNGQWKAVLAELKQSGEVAAGTRLMLQALINITADKPAELLEDISSLVEEKEDKKQLSGLSKCETMVRSRLRQACLAMKELKDPPLSFNTVLYECYQRLALAFDEPSVDAAESLTRVYNSLLNKHREDFDPGVAQYLKKEVSGYFRLMIHLKTPVKVES